MSLAYKDFIIIRDLMKEVDDNSEPEDKLEEDEVATLAKIESVINEIEAKRARPAPARARVEWRKGRKVVVLPEKKAVRR